MCEPQGPLPLVCVGGACTSHRRGVQVGEPPSPGEGRVLVAHVAFEEVVCMQQ